MYFLFNSRAVGIMYSLFGNFVLLFLKVLKHELFFNLFVFALYFLSSFTLVRRRAASGATSQFSVCVWFTRFALNEGNAFVVDWTCQ